VVNAVTSIGNAESRPPTTTRLLDHRSNGSHHSEKYGSGSHKNDGTCLCTGPWKTPFSVAVERYPRYRHKYQIKLMSFSWIPFHWGPIETDKPADNNSQDAAVWIYRVIPCPYFRSFLVLYLLHLISVNDEAAG